MKRNNGNDRKKRMQSYNSASENNKTVNQNQEHNSRREGMGPNTKRKP